MARYLRSAIRRWKMRPVKSWALSTPVALTFLAVARNLPMTWAASSAGNLHQDIPCNGKNGIVIYIQDFAPGL